MLLRQLFELKHYNFVDESMSWQEALRKCIDPLLADGSVEPEYADCLIENVEKRGPYIVLLPGVAMPHAVEGAVGTNREAISFMHVKEPCRRGFPPAEHAAPCCGPVQPRGCRAPQERREAR